MISAPALLAEPLIVGTRRGNRAALQKTSKLLWGDRYAQKNLGRIGTHTRVAFSVGGDDTRAGRSLFEKHLDRGLGWLGVVNGDCWAGH